MASFIVMVAISSRIASIGTELPVRGDVGHDDAWIQLLHHVIAKAHLVDGPGAEVLHHHVGDLDQLAQGRLRFLLAKSMLRLFLPLLYWTQYALCLRTYGEWYRVSSPPRRSILMTSAPRRATNWAHRGPAYDDPDRSRESRSTVPLLVLMVNYQAEVAARSVCSASTPCHAGSYPPRSALASISRSSARAHHPRKNR